MKYKSIPFILCIIAGHVLAQGDLVYRPGNINRFHKLGVNVGVQKETLLDEVYSPLLYNGTGAGFGLQYELERLYSYHRVTLRGSGHPISPTDASIPESFNYLLRGQEWRITHYSANATKLDLRYDYQRLVSRFTRYQLKWYVGGSLDHRLYYFKMNSKQDRSWIIAYSLEASTKLEYIRSCNHALSIQLFLPLVSLVHRPPYAGYDRNSMHYTGFDYLLRVKPMNVNRYHFLSGAVAYEYYLDCRTALSFSWESSFTVCTLPRSLSLLSHHFKLGMIFLFRSKR